MPIKPLPSNLISRLRTLAFKSGERKAFSALGRMKNVDHRKDLPSRVSSTNPEHTSYWGGRVREMNVSRNYPGVELVIKRTHTGPVKNIRIHLDELYAQCVKSKPEKYVLQKPIFYEIHDNLIAMAKVHNPSIAEIIGEADKKTERGRSFFEAFKLKHKVTQEQLEHASSELISHVKYLDGNKTILQNMIVLGFEKGKFVFMSLPDII